VAQLHVAGLGPDKIKRRVQMGRLHRIHRGVYAVGHRGISERGRWMAATLALGEAAVISHRSAATLWDLLPPSGDDVDVTIPGDAGRRRRPGIRLHRSSLLEARHSTRRWAIPVTTPAQMLSDLPGAVTAQELRRAQRQAAVRGLALGEDTEHDGTRSELEVRFLQLCQSNNIPPPQVNVRLGSLLVDFLWAHRRLVIETDGYRYHRGRFAFENDRARDLELRACGYDVIASPIDRSWMRRTRLAPS
jgi:Protein of unknown function (DUF559)